jgi:hypothetical protein
MAKARSYTEEQVLALWRPPKMRGVKNGEDYFQYNSIGEGEHGAYAALVVPIPLSVSTRPFQTILYFAQDRLVATSHEIDKDRGGVCSPLFMFEGPDTSPCVH